MNPPCLRERIRRGRKGLAALLVTLGPLAPTRALAEPEEVQILGRSQGGFSAKAREDGSAREVTDAASLVAPLPGVHVRRLGGDDAFSSLSVRGTGSSQVAVFLAGVPLTGGADPTVDLASLPLWPGAEARVYRSFAPASLGRGSLGGTLVLRGPPVTGPARTDLWAAAGSFGALRLRAGDLRPLGQGELSPRLATAVSASRSDGDFTYLDPGATERRGEDTFRTRENARVSAANGLMSLALPFALPRGRHGVVTLLALAQARRSGVPGTITNPARVESLSTSRLVSAVELALPLGEASVFSLRSYGRREGLALRNSREEAQLTLGPTVTDDAIVAAGGSVGLLARPARPLRVEARLDGSVERYLPGTWEGSTAPPGASRSSLGLAGDAGWRVLPELFLSASARADLWRDDSGVVGKDEARGTGHLGAELTLGSLVLAAHAGPLSRPPSFVERYGNRGAFLGSPGLRPEAATTVDAGARASARQGRLGASAELVGFSTWAKDLIVFVPQGALGRALATNVGLARILGLEADLRGKIAFVPLEGLPGAVEIRASYTFLATTNDAECDAPILTSSGRCDAPPLPGRPAHDLVADLVGVLGPLRLRYGLDATAGLRIDLRGSVPVPARVLHGVGARLSVPRVPGLTVALDIANLGDLRAASYQGASGPVRVPIGDLYEYPLPGRTFLASARFSAGGAP